MNVAILDADRRVRRTVDERSIRDLARDDDQVQLRWIRDPYPAMEAYHIYPDGEIVTLADDDADLGAVIGLVSDADDSAGFEHWLNRAAANRASSPNGRLIRPRRLRHRDGNLAPTQGARNR